MNERMAGAWGGVSLALVAASLHADPIGDWGGDDKRTGKGRTPVMVKREPHEATKGKAKSTSLRRMLANKRRG